MAVLAMDPRTVQFRSGAPSVAAYPASAGGSAMTGGVFGGFETAPITAGPRPQPLMDSDPADGPVSVAYGMKKELVEIRQKYPAPATSQYIHREASVLREKEILQECRPSPESDVCGWVMATADPNGSYGGDHPDNDYSADRMNLKFDNFRLVFQCVSGTALMHWASEEDFKIGIFGARRAPRALAWWDLRKAYDVVVQPGDPSFDIAAGQFTILMYGGNLSFAVESEQDIPIWYNAVRAVIRDAAWHQATKAGGRDQQRKRWHAATGLARALLNGRPIASRALAVTFHLYDIDMDCVFRLGEVMLLIKEVYAAMIQDSGLAEGATMDLALQSSSFRLPLDMLFEKALIFRRQCDQSNDGRISKVEFARFGHEALLEAVSM